VAVDVTPPMPDDLDEGDSTMTDPTHSPRPQTLAAARRSSLAAIGLLDRGDPRGDPGLVPLSRWGGSVHPQKEPAPEALPARPGASGGDRMIQ
jgi:hypothetical protein